MFNNNLDTLVTYTLDPVCVIGEFCKIHKYKHIEIISKYGKVTEMQANYLNENFDLNKNYFVSESGQIFFTEKETTAVNYNLQSPKVEIRFSDTLKLNDLKYLKQGDLRSAKELIVLREAKQNIKQQNDLNGPANSLVFTFMLFCSAIYLIRSFGDWINMFSKINFALKS